MNTERLTASGSSSEEEKGEDTTFTFKLSAISPSHAFTSLPPGARNPSPWEDHAPVLLSLGSPTNRVSTADVPKLNLAAATLGRSGTASKSSLTSSRTSLSTHRSKGRRSSIQSIAGKHKKGTTTRRRNRSKAHGRRGATARSRKGSLQPLRLSPVSPSNSFKLPSARGSEPNSNATPAAIRQKKQALEEKAIQRLLFRSFSFGQYAVKDSARSSGHQSPHTKPGEGDATGRSMHSHSSATAANQLPSTRRSSLSSRASASSHRAGPGMSQPHRAPKTVQGATAGGTADQQPLAPKLLAEVAPKKLLLKPLKQQESGSRPSTTKSRREGSRVVAALKAQGSAARLQRQNTSGSSSRRTLKKQSSDSDNSVFGCFYY